MYFTSVYALSLNVTPIVAGASLVASRTAATMQEESIPPLRNVATGTSDTRRKRTLSTISSRTRAAASRYDDTVPVAPPQADDLSMLQNVPSALRLFDRCSHAPGLSSC